jgi:anaphase-promoting complex subunit 3
MLHKLPEKHLKSVLANQMLGRAYYEMNEYRPSVLAFKEMLRLEPFRLKGLEILSTALWHLKSEKELCTLAQQVVEVDKFSPETWCVVGNCFSLQCEPDVAIKFFKRALQIDPTFAYAHTLSGHELVNNEDLEKAVTSFRQAILHNDRHYNAWYGLGSLYYRQERYDLAEYHFKRALSINPASSVLHCYLGI